MGAELGGLDEVDRMSRLVKDLITLAKTDRPDFFTFAPVGVAPLTETVLDKCRALGPRDWRLDETAQSVAIMDEHRVTQALLQLAENAVKHTFEGDEIGVGARMDGRRGVLMWVRDTGPGVRPEDRAVIFERFGRGRVAVGDEGFGLGLSIVTAIAHAHGGTVTVQDVVPHGAKFVLALPADRKDGSWHAS